MDQSLDTQLVHSIFRFKRLVSSGLGMDAAENKSAINMTELMLMNGIVNNTADSENNVGPSDIRSYLSISKGAVSQMLGSLEKKGFINREIDRNNRRNLIVTLTSEGRRILKRQYNEFSGKLEKIIGRLGEDDVTQMIRIVNRMITITNELAVESEHEQAG
ncbi:MarR family winged helix-turn-helix transcriptional regulator [Breznakiella homolactica]|uniref:Transcriptional regulator n=1 Tax=Breznakiella homolactica TaxID=2798577 RepID=A0A7T8BBE8_9SPIR|nr:transcriptional regulator [Breznakiella homolactica]QQO10487.1 transcriptional regulator [Breznakiella homolactica]